MHQLKVAQLKQWLARSGGNPRDVLLRKKLRSILEALAFFLLPQELVLPHEFEKLVKIDVIALVFEVFDHAVGVGNVAVFHHLHPVLIPFFVPMSHSWISIAGNSDKPLGSILSANRVRLRKPNLGPRRG